MAVLSPTGVETHPLGTTNVNAIITNNWQVLNDYIANMELDLTSIETDIATLQSDVTSLIARDLLAPYVLKTGNIDGKTLATTTLVNPLSGKDLIPIDIQIIPITFTVVIVQPQIEVGESVVATNSFVDAVIPSLANDGSQTQKLTLKNPIPKIIDGGSLKVKVNIVATATVHSFQIWVTCLIK